MLNNTLGKLIQGYSATDAATIRLHGNQFIYGDGGICTVLDGWNDCKGKQLSAPEAAAALLHGETLSAGEVFKLVDGLIVGPNGEYKGKLSDLKCL